MPSSLVSRFSDPHHLQSAIRAGTCEVLARSKGGFKSEWTRIDLDRLWMQAIHSDGPYLYTAANSPERVPVYFLAEAEHAPVRFNGLDLTPQEIVFFRRGANYRVSFDQPSIVASMSLSPDDLASAAQTILGQELAVPRETRIVRPTPALMMRLRALHKAAREFARDRPAALTHPATVRALEHELVHLMLNCITAAPAKESRVHGAHHFQVIARFEDFLAAKKYEPAYVAEICAAIGVSERTLRTCCQQHLGMGPIHYLWLRRMHLARRSLLNADPARNNVTEIATAHGFWELGRFSVEYRRLFGELPSATLKRPAQEMPGAKAH